MTQCLARRRQKKLETRSDPEWSAGNIQALRIGPSSLVWAHEGPNTDEIRRPSGGCKVPRVAGCQSWGTRTPSFATGAKPPFGLIHLTGEP